MHLNLVVAQGQNVESSPTLARYFFPHRYCSIRSIHYENRGLTRIITFPAESKQHEIRYVSLQLNSKTVFQQLERASTVVHHQPSHGWVDPELNARWMGLAKYNLKTFFFLPLSISIEGGLRLRSNQIGR